MFVSLLKACLICMVRWVHFKGVAAMEFFVIALGRLVFFLFFLCFFLRFFWASPSRHKYGIRQPKNN
ncbi:hypothetical protein BURK_031199 [Burkholderia sp. SJ98]|nr:hypothetical protein BURK_031199 [Burkholderia sp. SJ98]